MKNTKNLVIIESPAKARSLKSYLGDNYEIFASYGHVRDLPRHYIGVDEKNSFKPTYTILPDKRKIVAHLKKIASGFSRIYLAADPDREGESICWHLSQILEEDGRVFKRLRFNAVTKETVLKALKNPSVIDMQLVDAQQARRVMDRLVGYKISSYLQRILGRGKSAGRVQTVVLRIIQQREDEISNFIPVEHWLIEAEFHQNDKVIKVSLFCVDGKRADKPGKAPRSSEEALIIHQRLKDYKGDWTLSGIQRKIRSVKPPPPFITSTLQQAASTRLSYSPSKTMTIAQQLYEGISLGEKGRSGLITYMRTDSVRISPDSIKECREYISDKYGSNMLSKSPNRYRSSKGSQDAHEAIRPASSKLAPEMLSKVLTSPQLALYSLIWNRFLATQMKNAEIEKTEFSVTGAGLEFKCTGDRLLSKGFSIIDRAYVRIEKELPDMKEGSIIFDSETREQRFTSPPPRFSEARLVAEMKKKGIGRPSTYVSTIGTLKNRKYVIKDGGVLKPTELGTTTERLLVRMFPHIFEIGFTASMEDLLDSIANGDESYVDVLQKLNLPLVSSLEKAMATISDVRSDLQEATEEVCPECGSPLIVRWGKYGKFKACSAFPKCKFSKPVEENSAVIFEDRSCPVCGGKLLLNIGRYGRYLRCEKYPDCGHTEPVPLGVSCPIPDCGGELVEKRSRTGRIFYSCSRYPECKYAIWNKPLDRICPRCGFPILEERKKGIWCPSCKKRISN